MSEEKMRAEFEIAAKTAQGLDVTRLPHGGYRSFATHQAWWAWQASRAAPDVKALVEALEAVVFYHEKVEDNDGRLLMYYSKMMRKVHEALAAHRKGGDQT